MTALVILREYKHPVNKTWEHFTNDGCCLEHAYIVFYSQISSASPQKQTKKKKIYRPNLVTSNNFKALNKDYSSQQQEPFNWHCPIKFQILSSL